MARALIEKCFQILCPPQTCAHTNFLWCQWGAKRSVKRAQTQELRPLSASTEISRKNPFHIIQPGRTALFHIYPDDVGLDTFILIRNTIRLGTILWQT